MWKNSFHQKHPKSFFFSLKSDYFSENHWRRSLKIASLLNSKIVSKTGLVNFSQSNRTQRGWVEQTEDRRSLSPLVSFNSAPCWSFRSQQDQLLHVPADRRCKWFCAYYSDQFLLVNQQTEGGVKGCRRQCSPLPPCTETPASWRRHESGQTPRRPPRCGRAGGSGTTTEREKRDELKGVEVREMMSKKEKDAEGLKKIK